VLDIPPDKRAIRLDGAAVELDGNTVVFGELEHGYPFSNTLIFSLSDAEGHPVLQRVCYSVGGGFLQWDGRSAPERGSPPYPFDSARGLRALVEESDLSLPQIIMDNEMAITGRGRPEILAELDVVINLMRRCVDRGIRAEGMLPGGLRVYRKAARLAHRADCMDDPLNRFLGLLNAYAFAVAEENAAGGIIVTAPTCGSAGVVPSMLTIMEGYLGFGPQAVRDGLLAAAAVGFLAKHNAGIAGAEVGCQGEVGVASAMAAAMLAQARGYPPRIVENAAEIALEHHLGLTCDPVGGYVQIPCIERNAMGALKAYNACLMATAEDPDRHRVSLDMAIQAMGETGHNMDRKYKETARGGLALSVSEC
jgi:L-serine dehydratase